VWLVRRRAWRETLSKDDRTDREETTLEAKDRSITHLGPGEGRSLWVSGQLLTRKVSAERTGGAYSLFEALIRPQGGPPPHVQHKEDEYFYVVEGEFEFMGDGRSIRAGAGSLVYVPRGNLHTYKNVGDQPGRLLISQTPGGTYERFFEEVGEEATAPPAMDGPPDVERLAAIAAGYGIEIPPLPPGDRAREKAKPLADPEVAGTSEGDRREEVHHG
jgi:mannose-6-phosphate isomerase-like protein (cupin superfamily)